jgi:HlyD family secretion protein
LPNKKSSFNSEKSEPSSTATMVIGWLLSATVVFFLGFSLLTISINGAVIAPGVVVVESGTQLIQHEDGGIIAKIFVEDGVQVKPGDILVRLDDIQIKKNLNLILERLFHSRVQAIRLRAEYEGSDKPSFPEDSSVIHAEAIEIEQANFVARRNDLDKRQALLRSQNSQKLSEIEGFKADIQSIDDQDKAAKLEYDAAKELYKKQIVPLTRILQLDRELASYVGRRGQRLSDIERNKQGIEETETKISQLAAEFRVSVLKDLVAANEQIRELLEKKIAYEDKLSRIDIRAPLGGFVHGRAVATVGGIVRPAETLMTIVPNEDRLVVDARVAAQDVDQVKVGQPVVVRLTNFNRRTTPELNASVSVLSADLATARPDSASQNLPRSPSYTARIAILDNELERLGGIKLLPGMMVDALIATEERTVMSYLLKPIADRMSLALRER